MSFIVTGGAGFIGSCLVRMLNENGINDIYLVDNIGITDKWKHLTNKRYLAYFNKREFLSVLPNLEDVECIIHMGACSSTTEKDFDYLVKNNFEYTKKLWEYCTNKKIPFIYASSAATYGDGSCGFDDSMDISVLNPLNAYGYSKQLFDLWVKKQANTPAQYVGLKFFNVYGPNEDCKGDMASVVFKAFNQISNEKKLNLFTSCNPNYENGGQLRDFVYVKDICKVILFFIKHPEINGLFNVGTGNARSFNDLAHACFSSMGIIPNIQYIEMPIHLRDKYQYYTEAKMNKLYSVGYDDTFYSLEDGINDYIRNYLIPKRVF